MATISVKSMSVKSYKTLTTSYKIYKK